MSPESVDRAGLRKSGRHALIECDRMLRAAPDYDLFHCLPSEWTCECGRSFVHVCDEAEGCGWTLADAKDADA